MNKNMLYMKLNSRKFTARGLKMGKRPGMDWGCLRMTGARPQGFLFLFRQSA